MSKKSKVQTTEVEENVRPCNWCIHHRSGLAYSYPWESCKKNWSDKQKGLFIGVLKNTCANWKEKPDTPVKQAVCLLIPSDNDTYVAISRRNNDLQWGLPGGKVDNGESSLDAVIRETSEEIGLQVSPINLKEIYQAICPGEVTYSVTTFLYRGLVKLDELTPEEGMTIKLLTAAELSNTNVSPFAEYNEGLFTAFKR